MVLKARDLRKCHAMFRLLIWSTEKEIHHVIPALSIIPGYPGSAGSEDSIAAECIYECEIEFLEQERYSMKWHFH